MEKKEKRAISCPLSCPLSFLVVGGLPLLRVGLWYSKPCLLWIVFKKIQYFRGIVLDT